MGRERSVLSGSKNSPTKVVPGQGWAANGNIPDSARSQLTHSTMDSDDLNDLVSGKLHRSREKSTIVDMSTNKSTAHKGDDFGDMVYDLEEDGYNDDNHVENVDRNSYNEVNGNNNENNKDPYHSQVDALDAFEASGANYFSQMMRK